MRYKEMVSSTLPKALAAPNAQDTGVPASQVYAMTVNNGWPILNFTVDGDGEIVYTGARHSEVYVKVGYRPFRIWTNGTMIIGHEWDFDDLITITPGSTSTVDGHNGASTQVAIAGDGSAVTVGPDVLPIKSAAISSIRQDTSNKRSRAQAQESEQASVMATPTGSPSAVKPTAIASTNPKGSASSPVETQSQSKVPTSASSSTPTTETHQNSCSVLSVHNTLVYILLLSSALFNTE
jgi:hypothetical protein